jgi:hypothetical protein
MASLTQTMPDLRPRFADGQVLTAGDLTAEQTYLIAARRRHLLSGHTPGIVFGLEPSLQNGVVTVSPGLAIDGVGRELIVSEATAARSGPAALGSGSEMGIYVQYDPVAAPGAGPAHPRLSEQADVFTGPVSADAAPVCNVTALPDDASAPPSPVLLGVVKAGGAGVEVTRRMYAGAIGSAASAPQGTSRIAFGRAGSLSVLVAGQTESAVRVDADGTTVAGDAVVDGSLTLGTPGGPASSGSCPLTLQSQPASAGASPWALCRTSVPATAPTATTPGTPACEELRIVLPAPPAGPGPTQQAVSVGGQDSGESFARTLSVLTDGTVVINGDLHITGRLATAPAPVDASDPRLRQALLANFVSGVQAGIGVLEEQYTGRLALTKLQLQASGGGVACTLSLDNVGAVEVDNIAVTAAVWLEGTPATTPDQTLATSVQLKAGASLAVHGNLKAPGSGSMNVLVRASGSGLAGTTIQASDLTGSVKV